MTVRGQLRDLGRRRPWWLAAAVAVILLGTATFVLTSCGGTGRTDATSSPRQVPPSAPAPVTASPTPTPSPTPLPGADLAGPLNLLLVGIDTRVSVPGWEPHADAVLIMHIPRGLDRAYLFSLPRDLVVEIPAFPKANYRGGRTKLTHAMLYGSRPAGRRNAPDPAQGYELLATTVSRYTGIKRFDAGAVFTFGALDNLVDAVGGIDLYIDQRVVSQHRRPDGKHRTLRSGGGGYVGPQMVYEKGTRRLTGWQAIDYARQRYTAGGDYTRQRHQQQIIRAIMTRVVAQDLTRDPDRLGAVIRAIGSGFTFIGQGRQVIDFSFALSGLGPERLTLIGLPGRAVGSGSGYRGEQLDPVGRKFLAELRAGRVDAFLAANPKLVVKT